MKYKYQDNETFLGLPIEARRKLKSGKMYADGTSFRQLSRLTPSELRRAIDTIINGDLPSLSDAIDAARIKRRRSATFRDHDWKNCVARMTSCINEREEHFKDEHLGHHEKCIVFLRELNKHWEAWIKEYA